MDRAKSRRRVAASAVKGRTSGGCWVVGCTRVPALPWDDRGEAPTPSPHPSHHGAPVSPRPRARGKGSRSRWSGRWRWRTGRGRGGAEGGEVVEEGVAVGTA